MDTRLQVINQDPAGLKITICGNGQCKAAKDLQVGESDDMAAEDVNGWVRFADGYQVDFAAGNPDIGRPWIELKGPPSNGAGDGDTTRLGLDVGGVQETAEDQLASYPFVGSRGPDTDYKMLTLKVYAWGGGAGGAGGGGSGAGGEEEEE